MAKRRQARFTTQELEGLPELDDESSALWDEGLSEVARKLLTSAVRCFASNGFHATTTRDITSAVGLSPGALYVHFSSKENVLFEIIRTAHVHVLDYISEPSTAADNPTDEIYALVGRYTQWHARYHVAARVSQLELACLTAEHYEEVLAIRHRTNVIFRAAVERGTRSGAFADVDVNRITRAMLSLGIDLVRWYRRDGLDTPEQLGDFNARLALKMLAHPSDSPPR